MIINELKPVRRYSHRVNIGSLLIGEGCPIAVQSMCNTKTSDVEGSVKQITDLKEVEADLVRLTVPTMQDVDSLREIHDSVKKLNIPICADVHFNSSIADKCVEIVEKVRVNPGNYSAQDLVRQRFTNLLSLAESNNVAIRIGVNHGSLSSYMVDKWGDTPRGMAESALEFLRIAKDVHFNNIVVSLKSSNPRVMVESYRLCVKMMKEEGMTYPLHIGVTEAGEGREGRIKSSVGIGSLLADGIGDTIRVSLTEDPTEEIPVGRILADYFPKTWYESEEDTDIIKLAYDPFTYSRWHNIPVRVVDDKTDVQGWFHIKVRNDINMELYKSSPLIPIVVDSNEKSWVGGVRYFITLLKEGGIENPVILHKNYVGLTEDQVDIIASAEMGAILIDGLADGVWIEHNGVVEGNELGLQILQATRLLVSKAEIISCPGCGRTQYDLQRVAREVKRRFSMYKGLKIAVMGCIVNGPGEMADADWGYVGAGAGKVFIYKGHKQIMKVDQSEALDILENLVKEDL